jgi:hypothetical protein
MTDPMQRLSAAKEKADSRGHFKRFVAKCKKVDSWTESDVSEYTKLIGILMGSDDTAALGLFNEGVYQTADDARQSAMNIWKEFASA